MSVISEIQEQFDAVASSFGASILANDALEANVSALHSLVTNSGDTLNSSGSNASSVTQYGHTWQFSQSHVVGQYVNGDLVGPLVFSKDI